MRIIIKFMAQNSPSHVFKMRPSHILYVRSRSLPYIL